MWREENKEKQHYGDYLYMGNLEALPGFGEMGGGENEGTQARECENTHAPSEPAM